MLAVAFSGELSKEEVSALAYPAPLMVSIDELDCIPHWFSSSGGRVREHIKQMFVGWRHCNHYIVISKM